MMEKITETIIVNKIGKFQRQLDRIENQLDVIIFALKDKDGKL